MTYMLSTFDRQAEVDPADLAAVVVELCGGGYTVEQTADAMTALHDVEQGKALVRTVGRKTYRLEKEG